MKALYKVVAIGLLLFSFTAHSQTPLPVLQFQKALGGTDEEIGYSVVQATDGGYVIAGTVLSLNGDVTCTFNARKIWVVKLSITGTIVWRRCLGGNAAENAPTIKNTPDGGYVVVGTSNSSSIPTYHGGNADVYVAKLDVDGLVQWQRLYGGSQADRGSDVLPVGNGFIFLGETSSNDGDVSGNHGQLDAWVVRLDSIGGIQWQQCHGGLGADATENFMKRGAIAATNDGGYILSAFTASGDIPGIHGPVSNGDVYVAKISSTGTLTWHRAYGGSGIEYPGDIQQTADGGYVLSATTRSPDGDVPAIHGIAFDSWIVRLNNDGNIRWSKTYGGNNIDEGTRLLIDSDGGFIVAGSTFSNDGDVSGNHGSVDAWVFKIQDMAGAAPTWSKVFGGSAGDAFYDLAFAEDGELIFAGSTQSNNGDVSGFHGSNPSIPDMWFVKGGRVNFIKGTVFIDNNLNGIRDAGDTDAKNILVRSSKPGKVWESITVNGSFENRVDTGTITTTVQLSNSYYTVVPASHQSVFTTYFNTDSFGFALQPVPNQRDYRISLIPLNVARPGFIVQYKLQLTNVGTDVLTNRQVVFIKDRMTYLNATPIQTDVSGDTIKWTIPLLNPNDSTSITVRLQLNAPPTVNNGDTLLLKAAVDSTGDLVPANNLSVLRQITQGAFDPNDKIENSGHVITRQEVAASKALTYTIRFQNTGTDTAFNVVIRDTLDAKLDWSGFEMLAASHPVKLQIIDGNILTWTFDNILLPDSNVNEPASHGFVSYRIKVDNNLLQGDTVKNTASIYFDFNLPVRTNTENTIVVNPAALPVRLMQFEGVLNNGIVNLNWKTATEQNTSVFEIERSLNGVNYERIGSVNASGLANGAAYAFKDLAPAAGYNYYRLKIIDEDGRFVYSTVVVINARKTGKLTLLVYPNPTPNGIVSINITGQLKGLSRIDVLDVRGRQVMSRNLGNVQADSYSTTLQLTQLQKGMYTIRLVSGDDVITNKIIIQ